MTEIILSYPEFVSFVDVHNGIVVGQPSVINKGIREYTQYDVLCPLSAGRKVLNLIKVLAITIFTGFLALFSKNVRALWSEVFNDKRVIVLAHLNIADLSADNLGGVAKYLNVKEISTLLQCWKFKGDPSLVSRVVELKADIEMPLVCGTVNISKRIITMHDEIVNYDSCQYDLFYKKNHRQTLDFVKEALPCFGKNHYACIYCEDGSVMYVYLDNDGKIKDLSTANPDVDGYIQPEIRKEMTRVVNTMKQVSLKIPGAPDPSNHLVLVH